MLRPELPEVPDNVDWTASGGLASSRIGLTVAFGTAATLAVVAVGSTRVGSMVGVSVSAGANVACTVSVGGTGVASGGAAVAAPVGWLTTAPGKLVAVAGCPVWAGGTVTLAAGAVAEAVRASAVAVAVPVDTAG